VKGFFEKMLTGVDVEAQSKQEFVELFSGSEETRDFGVLSKAWSGGKAGRERFKEVFEATFRDSYKPNIAEVHSMLGSVYKGFENFENAGKYFERAAELEWIEGAFLKKRSPIPSDFNSMLKVRAN
jgi:hypothetical protein